jgi:hypothetical protein
MALAADDSGIRLALADSNRFTVVNANQIFKGSIVGLDTATGRIRTWADVTNLLVCGHAQEGGTGDAGGTVTAAVSTGVRILQKVACTGVTAITDIGTAVHATDDNTLTLTPGSNAPAIGRVVAFHTGTTVDVLLTAMS